MPNAIQAVETPYDELQYRSTSFPASRLDNLAALGVLAGLSPAPVDHCRVLEIGCAAGGNLIPMAALFPHSSFVGIDLSARQILHGQDLIAHAQLQNIRLCCEDVLNYQPEGKYDYIIAHGIYSWVPVEVRNRLMLLIGGHLSAQGIAYVSFNALPGFYIKQISRDMMRYHGRDSTTVRGRLAKGREILDLAAAAVPDQNTPYLTSVRALAAELGSREDWFLAHDDLEDVCEPVYLHEFVKHAISSGLSYIGGAKPITNLGSMISPELRNHLTGFCSNAVELEQYCDFLIGTRYRDAILSPITTSPSLPVGIARLRKLYFAARLVEFTDSSTPQRFGEIKFRNETTRGSMLMTDPTLIDVLRHLGKSWPHAIGFEELHAFARDRSSGPEVTVEFMAQNLHALFCSNMLELWTRPTKFIATNTERPFVSKLARIQAQRGGPVSTLRHEEFMPCDDFVRTMLPLMDGTRDLDTLATQLMGALVRNQFRLDTPSGPVATSRDAREFIGRALEVFQNASILAASSG